MASIADQLALARHVGFVCFHLDRAGEAACDIRFDALALELLDLQAQLLDLKEQLLQLGRKQPTLRTLACPPQRHVHEPLPF